MIQNPSSKSASAGRRRRRRSGSRTWIWVLVSAVLLLLLIGAGIAGYLSDSSLRSAIQEQLAENRRQEEALRVLSAEGEERDARLAAIDEEIAGKDAQIEADKAELADKDARIGALDAALAEKDAQILSRSDESAGRDEQILARSAESADRDEQILARSAESADRDPAIEALNQQIADTAALIPAEPVFTPAEAEDSPAPQEPSPQADEWGYVDEDGDGLILVPIRGKFTGYMLIVLDPSRVVLGCEPKAIYSWGYDVQHYVEKEDGVAGVNGGGFADDGGRGNGSTPDHLFVHEGVIYCGGSGIGYGFAGLDDQYVLHVGIDNEEVKTLHIMEGCGYGPVLIKDGEMNTPEKLRSGLNPRTAIGQRSDGAILLLVTEGRQPSRIGCSYTDEAELMLSFGAVNACNMDGGSSTMMWYGGEYINNRANVINTRPIPTSWVVLKEGRDRND